MTRHVFYASADPSRNRDIETRLFTEIGDGWFFALDEDWMMADGGCPLGFIGDAFSERTSESYGPAAWNGLPGPASSLTLATISGIPKDHEYASKPFPGTVRITSAGMEAGLGALDGLLVASLDELLGAPCLNRKGGRSVTISREERLSSIRRLHPGLGAQ
jgi:hypothetical protein